MLLSLISNNIKVCAVLIRKPCHSIIIDKMSKVRNASKRKVVADKENDENATGDAKKPSGSKKGKKIKNVIEDSVNENKEPKGDEVIVKKPSTSKSVPKKNDLTKEPKSRLNLRSAKKKEEAEKINYDIEKDPESSEEEAAPPKKTKKPTEKKATGKSTTKPKPKKDAEDDDDDVEVASSLKNQMHTDYSKLSFECTTKNANGKTANFKISTWNVDGIKAWIKKNGIQFIQEEDPDVICLQETKCNKDKLPAEIVDLPNYKSYWCDSLKAGYAGVGLLSKTEPLSVLYGIENEEHDADGRCITAEYDKFYVISVYVTNAGRGLVTLDKRLDWNEAFKNFIKKLDENKPVIICGDMNVAHSEIDLKNPKTNKKNAGFTIEERTGMTDFLAEGFVDTFRSLYPDKIDAYTFWSYMKNARAKNIGWRLDYFIVSNRLMDNICDNVVRDKVFGSDHCPITLFLNM